MTDFIVHYGKWKDWEGLNKMIKNATREEYGAFMASVFFNTVEAAYTHSGLDTSIEEEVKNISAKDIKEAIRKVKFLTLAKKASKGIKEFIPYAKRYISFLVIKHFNPSWRKELKGNWKDYNKEGEMGFIGKVNSWKMAKRVKSMNPVEVVGFFAKCAEVSYRKGLEFLEDKAEEVFSPFMEMEKEKRPAVPSVEDLSKRYPQLKVKKPKGRFKK